MVCQNCGKNLSEGETICDVCGTVAVEQPNNSHNMGELISFSSKKSVILRLILIKTNQSNGRFYFPEYLRLSP
ncbi:MAG: hypothetical protein ACOX45_02970 [Acutalibacteraceae bacterium]